jgi:hypothetical protein
MKAKAKVDFSPYRSELEMLYAQFLDQLVREGVIHSYYYEPSTWHLGYRMSYCPDFLVILPDGSMEWHEVKGRPREDALVKLKAAASQYPLFSWALITAKIRKKGCTFYRKDVGSDALREVGHLHLDGRENGNGKRR